MLPKCLIFIDEFICLVAANEKDDTEKDVNTAEVVKQNDEPDEQLPRALHKTQSIFLRNLPTLITRQEIEEVCVCVCVDCFLSAVCY